MIREGHHSPWYRDVYVFLLEISWLRLVLLGTLSFLLIHAVFACVYLIAGPCIQGARPGHFWDAYFFSVQTLSTIGYGGMFPIGFIGNIIVTLESLLGLVGLALATGLVFSKFARPTTRVLFSRTALIHMHNQQPSLKFRLANARNTNIIEASLRVTILKSEISTEGYRLQKLYDADIVRDFTPVFLMSWLVIHPIDENSPLYQMTPEDIHENNVLIIVTMTGIDGAFSQTVHTHYTYWPEDIIWDMEFVDMLEFTPNNMSKIHYNRIHDLVPVSKDMPKCAPSNKNQKEAQDIQ